MSTESLAAHANCFDESWSVKWLDRAAFLMLGALLLFATIRFWPDWTHNPDLSHGLATPLVFVILLRRSATGASCRKVIPTTIATIASLVGLVSFLAANLYAAALEWTHSLVLSLLGVACGCMVISVFTAVAPFRKLRIPPWPLAVAALIWPLSAPIPPGTYTRLTQTLQSAISAGVLPILHLLGIAAERASNVIVLAHVSVGVEEACSGVRSLVSCLFAGLFLSAVLVQRPIFRAALITLSIVGAIGMNFLRSLFLTLLANGGVNIERGWHDATGYAILLLTAGLLLIFACLQATPARRRSSEKHLHVVSNIPGQKAIPARWPLLHATITLGLIGTIWLLFTVKTRSHPAMARTVEAPRVEDLIPAAAAGWKVTTREDLYQFSSELRTRFLAERSFTRTRAGGEDQVTIYVAFWPAGQVPVSLVEAHTPDACWPGGGWRENPALHQHVNLLVESSRLPTAEFRVFRLDDYPQNVWYWHLFDGQVITPTGTASPRALLSLAWHYGFRKDGEQYFVRISSNRSWAEISREPLLHDALTRLKSIGL